MLDLYQTTKNLTQEEIKSYFPKNIEDLYELNNLSFFGIKNSQIYKQRDLDLVKHEQYFFSILCDDFLLQNIGLMNDSKELKLLQSALELDLLKNDYKELKSKSPLLITKLDTHFIKAQEDYLFLELQKYADHEEFRGRGIATKVFNSICEKAKQDGLKYIYIQDETKNGWPTKSKLIDSNYLTEEMINEIYSIYFHTLKEDVFNVPDSRNLVRILNDIEHEKIFQEFTKNQKGTVNLRSKEINL